MSYLSEQYFEIMDWPPQSPDLNPIENLWKTLGVKVKERNPTNTDDLWVKLQEELLIFFFLFLPPPQCVLVVWVLWHINLFVGF